MLCLVIQRVMPTIPLGFCLRVIVNEKPLNLENTTSSVLSVLLLIYGGNFYLCMVCIRNPGLCNTSKQLHHRSNSYKRCPRPCSLKVNVKKI